MARDFSSQRVDNSLPCGQLVVLWSALESAGVLPSLGDILETGDGCGEPELVTRNDFPASRPFTIPSVVAVAHDDPQRGCAWRVLLPCGEAKP